MTSEHKLRPIWAEHNTVKVIDQRLLPHQYVVVDLNTVDDAIMAIKDMYVRGAPLIGVTGAYGVFLACLTSSQSWIAECDRIKAARPTAVNLTWAVDRIKGMLLSESDPQKRTLIARQQADQIAEEEVENCRQIGIHGLEIIKRISAKNPGRTINVLTHCNAGWLACVEYGTATAPIYAAFDHGIDIHVWVDETRPWNQGARLTAWELGQKGVQHTVITDNAGGHLMQHGMVDLVIVGTDRTTKTGDVANKIGTYLKALAARDNNIPFYVALPSSTFDWNLTDGIKEIPIEQREGDEIRYVYGLCDSDAKNKNLNHITRVRIMPEKSAAANYAFDVTPARLVTGFITERGVCGASLEEIKTLFPEKA